MVNPYDEFRANFIDNTGYAPASNDPGRPQDNAILRSLVASGMTSASDRIHRNLISQAALEGIARYLIMSTFPAMASRPQQVANNTEGLLRLAQEQNFQYRPSPILPPDNPTQERNWSAFFGQREAAAERPYPSFAPYGSGGVQAYYDQIRREYLEREGIDPKDAPWIRKPQPTKEPWPGYQASHDAQGLRVLSKEEGDKVLEELARTRDSYLEQYIQEAMDLDQEIRDLQAYIESGQGNPGDESRLASLISRREDVRKIIDEGSAQPRFTALNEAAMVALEALDLPRVRMAMELGELAYRAQTKGDLIDGNSVRDFARVAIASMASGVHWLANLGQVDKEELFINWMDDPDNRDAIIDAYENGFGVLRIDSNGDGIVDSTMPAFAGGRAVWELFVADMNGWGRAVYDIAIDPTVFIGAATLPMSKAGSALTRTAAESASLTGLSRPALTAVGEALQLPHAAYTALDKPVDALISGIGTLIPGGGTLTDSARAATQAETFADTGQWAGMIFDEFNAPTPTGAAPSTGAPGAAPSPNGLSGAPGPSTNMVATGGDPQATASSLIDGALTNGGATVGIDGSIPTSGYVIGGADGVESVVIENAAQRSRDELEAIAREFVEKNPGHSHYGSWMDPETGSIHLDVSDFSDDLSDAISRAQERGELAIWGIAEGEEIRTPPKGAEVEAPAPGGAVATPSEIPAPYIPTKKQWYEDLASGTKTISDTRLGGRRILDEAYSASMADPQKGTAFYRELAPLKKAADEESIRIKEDRSFGYDNRVDPSKQVQARRKKQGKPTFVPTEKQVKEAMPHYRYAGMVAEAFVRHFGRPFAEAGSYIKKRIPKDATDSWLRENPISILQEAVFGPSETAAKAFAYMGRYWRQTEWGPAIIDELEELRKTMHRTGVVPGRPSGEGAVPLPARTDDLVPAQAAAPELPPSDTPPVRPETPPAPTPLAAADAASQVLPDPVPAPATLATPTRQPKGSGTTSLKEVGIKPATQPKKPPKTRVTAVELKKETIVQSDTGAFLFVRPDGDGYWSIFNLAGKQIGFETGKNAKDKAVRSARRMIEANDPEIWRGQGLAKYRLWDLMTPEERIMFTGSPDPRALIHDTTMGVPDPRDRWAITHMGGGALQRIADEYIDRLQAMFNQVVPGSMLYKRMRSGVSWEERAAAPDVRELLDAALPPEDFVRLGPEFSAKRPLVAYDYGPKEHGLKVYIPGGLDGEFSLFEVILLESQMFDPAQLGDEVAQGLYEKLFRSIGALGRGRIDDPVELARRMTLAITSARTPLNDNQAIMAQLVRNEQDILRLAKLADDIEAGRIPVDGPKPNNRGDAIWRELYGGKGPGVGMGASTWFVAKSMQLMRDAPELFRMRPEETVLEFSERLANILPGAGAKVATFGAMLADPMSHPVGTIDVHMVNIITDWAARNLSPSEFKKTFKVGTKDDLILKYGLATDETLATRDIGRSAEAQARAVGVLKKEGALPSWYDPSINVKDNKILSVDSGDYKIFNDLLKRMKKQDGLEHWGNGAYQWYRWDRYRGLFEGHTAVWPGVGDVPRRSFDDFRAVLSSQREGGYNRVGPAGGIPRNPILGADPVTGRATNLAALYAQHPLLVQLDNAIDQKLERMAEEGVSRYDSIRVQLLPDPATGTVDQRLDFAVNELGMPRDHATTLAQKVEWNGVEMSLLDFFFANLQLGRNIDEITKEAWGLVQAAGLEVPDYTRPGLMQKALPAPESNRVAQAIGTVPQVWREGVMYNPVSGPAAGIRDGLTNTIYVLAINGGTAAFNVAKNLPRLARGLDTARFVDDVTETYRAAGKPAPPQSQRQAFSAAGITGEALPKLQQGMDKLARAVGSGEKGARVARGMMSPLVAKWVRDLRMGMDVVARLFSGEARFAQRMGEQRLKFMLGVRRQLQQSGMQIPEINRILQDLADLGEERVGNRIFAPRDVKELMLRHGVDQGRAEQFSRAWARLSNEAWQQSRIDVDRALFSYKQTKADSALSKLLVFHYWQSRAIAQTARIVARNPWLLRVGYEMQQVFDESSNIPGLPAYLRGLLKVYGNGGTIMGFIDPINMIIPYATFREMAKMEGDERGFDEWAEAFGISPLVQSALAGLGLYQPFQAPNPLGSNAPFQALTAVLDLTRNFLLPELGDTSHIGVSDNVNIPQLLANRVTEWINQRLVGSSLDDAAESLGFDSLIQTQEFIELGSSRVRRVGEMVTQAYMEEHGLDYNDLTPEHLVEIGKILETDGTDSPHPLLLEAYQRETMHLATRRAINSLSPVPIVTAYGPRLEMDAIRRGEVPADQQTVNAVRDIASITTSAQPLLKAQVEGLQQVGTIASRQVYGDYNLLLFGDYEDLANEFGAGSSIMDANGNYLTLVEFANLSRDEREAIADAWLERTGQGPLLDWHKEERDSWIEKNPGLQSYLDWRDMYGDLSRDDLIAVRDQMMELNPAYEAYVKRLRPKDRENFGALFSVDAYLAWGGKQSSIYRKPESTGGGSLAAQTDLILRAQSQLSKSGSKGGSSQKKEQTREEEIADLEADIALAEANMQLYEQAVANITGVSNQEELHPYWQDALKDDPRVSAIEKPYIPNAVKDYWRWRDLMLAANPGADVSVAAYLDWIEQFQVDYAEAS